MPATLERRLTTLPALPLIVHALTVVVVPAANCTVCATVFVDANSLNVLLPVNAVVLVLVSPPIVSLLYVSPPPVKVRVAVVLLESTMLAVPLLNVSPVAGRLQTVPVPVNVHVPDPRLTVRVSPDADVKLAQVTLKVAALKLTDVIAPVVVRSSLSTQPKLAVVTQFKVASVTPFVVSSTPIPLAFNVPVHELTKFVVGKTIDRATDRLDAPANVST